MLEILLDIIKYPWRGNGKYMLLIGGILQIITYFAGYAFIIGGFATLFMMSYFCSTYFQLVQSTAVSYYDEPRFPEAANVLEDFIFPFFKVAFIFLVCFLPSIILWIATDEENTVLQEIVYYLCLTYTPMAILSYIILGDFAKLTPTHIIPSIVKAGWLYWLAIALLVTIYYVSFLAEAVLEDVLIIGPLILGFINMYTLMASARILGIVYREKEEDLAWL